MSRRGAVMAAVVLLMVAVNATILVAGASGGAASEAALRRVQTLRAFFAAESGAAVSVGEALAGRPIAAGIVVDLGGVQSFSVIAFPDLAEGGEIEVEGRSAGAARRVEITVE